MLRFGIRFEDLMDETNFRAKYDKFYLYCKEIFGVEPEDPTEWDRLMELRKYLAKEKIVRDTVQMLYDAMKEGKRVLAEGANGCLLDIDHGTYPFVTSSNTTIGGVCTGLGVPPQKIRTSIAVVKAYTTRVGSGPMECELNDAMGEKLQQKGAEFGVTTGRKRRCGWLDLKVLKRSVMLNGYSSIFLTKLDILSDLGDLKILLENGEYKTLSGWKEDITSVREFADLPENARKYVEFIEEYLETPVSWIGVGPARSEIIQKIK